MQWMRLVVGGLAIVLTAVGTAVFLGDWELRRARTEIDSLQKERLRLVAFAERLASSRRVAQIDVLEQVQVPSGFLLTRLRWQEIGTDGVLGPPLELEVRGSQVYVEALVLKFEPLAGGVGDDGPRPSVALFRRAFGEQQTPETGAPLDSQVHAQVEATAASADAELWQKFWQIADDPQLAARLGVRVAQCEAPSVLMRPRQTWNVSVDAIGGVSLTRVERGT
jgi:hypothetical protein